ncbi:MAG: extracellular solute-binding protein [Alphaproteobacteria bacterium]|nr:extracellular solute-binding protein [Alphaproteobacteria bacterium]
MKSRGNKLNRGLAFMAAVGATTALALGAPARADENTSSVSFFSWDNEDIVQPLIDAFEASQTEYSIAFSYAPPIEDYINTLQIRLSSGTAADVFVLASENRGPIIENGSAADISDIANVQRTGQKGQLLYGNGEEVYGAAPGAWAGGVIYNKDLLASVGYDDVPSDWSEFLELCAALSEAGIQPIVERGDEPMMLLAGNLGVVNEEFGARMDEQIWAGETTFAETWTEPFTKIRELVDAGYMPSNVVGLNFDTAVAQFASGEVAMFPTGTWAVNSVREAGPDLNLGMSAIPTDSGPFWGGTVSIGYAVNADAENIEGARAFVDFLMSDEALRIYQDTTGQIVTVEGFENDISDILTDAAAAATAGDIYWPQTWWVNNNQALFTHVVAVQQEVILGSRSPAAAAASIDEKLATLR